MHRHAIGVLWILAYVLVISSPLLFMVVQPVPPARPLLIEASVALGFVGLLMMAIQFVLIGRVQRLSAPFGIDTLLRYHRHIAGIALGFVIIHPLLLVLHDPALLSWFDPIGGTWASRTGAWAVYAFILLVFLSVFRRQLRIRYEAWRMSHTVLGVTAIVCALAHVHLAGRYTDVPWKEAILIGVSAVTVGAYGYVRLVKPALMRREPYTVREVRPERGNVWSLALQAEGHPGMRFLPGQYGYLKLGSPYTFDEHPFSFASSSESDTSRTCKSDGALSRPRGRADDSLLPLPSRGPRRKWRNRFTRICASGLEAVQPEPRVLATHPRVQLAGTLHPEYHRRRGGSRERRRFSPARPRRCS